MKFHIICPLCKGCAPHDDINHDGEIITAWFCEDCPFVGFEFWGSKDLREWLGADKIFMHTSDFSGE